TPPPPRLVSDSQIVAPPPVAVPTPNGASPDASPAPPGPGTAPPKLPGPIDSFVDAAGSNTARCGLTTRRALYQRMRLTRQLLRAWERAGKYINQPTRRLTRSGEALELNRQLNSVVRLLDDFAPLLGRLGQPGYWVASLARHDMIVPIFRMLVPSQRET